MDKVVSNNSNVVVEAAVETDFLSIQEIYRYYIENTVISFEEEVPSLEEMKQRWHAVTDNSLPFLVAKIGDKIVGYAYAARYHVRVGYRFTVEESIYLAPNYRGLKIGEKLLSRLVEECKRKGIKQMIATVAESDGNPSIRFHEKMGFKKLGVMEKVGFKFDRWVNVMFMQKSLN